MLARDSDLGQIWHNQKAVIYLAMDRLERPGYIAAIVAGAFQPRSGQVAIPGNPAGQGAATAWLNSPVDHPREVRSELLRRQHAQLAPIAAALTDRLRGATGLQRTLALWRSESISATHRFLETTGQPISSR